LTSAPPWYVAARSQGFSESAQSLERAIENIDGRHVGTWSIRSFGIHFALGHTRLLSSDLRTEPPGAHSSFTENSENFARMVGVWARAQALGTVLGARGVTTDGPSSRGGD